MALLKTPAQQTLLRAAGQRLAEVLTSLPAKVKPGVTPLELDTHIHQLMLELDCIPSFLNYEGYPNASCISRNDQVIHTIPDETPLQEGDIVTIDAGLWYKGVCVDAARTFPVGEVSAEAHRLMRTTATALADGVKAARAGSHIGAISSAIEKWAVKEDLGVIRHFTGHGVGLAVHEEPSIPNWGRVTDGPRIRAGMVLAIEPMFTLGGDEVDTLADGWTVVTVDGSLAAQFEHTVLITPKGPEILV